MIHTTLQRVQDTGGDHLTEDALWAGVFEHHAVLAIADGAPQRLRPIVSMQPLTNTYRARYGQGVTPSGVASRLLCSTVAELASTAHTPAEMVIAANERLAADLRAIYGDISTAALLQAEPHLTVLSEDARYIRLVLPAATYTVARIDWEKQQLEVAHGADSALIAFQQDDTAVRITPDQMVQHDDKAKSLYLTDPDAKAEHPFFQALGDSRAREINRLNGLYHNFVSPDGQTDPAVGVSVINGLPNVADYMFQTCLPLDQYKAVLLVSDGMFLPSQAPEDGLEPINTSTTQLQLMGDLVLSQGLKGYVEHLRREETRVMNTPGALAWHDDASGLFFAWEI
jgi:serine/threonine protein phosphatase PrpC